MVRLRPQGRIRGVQRREVFVGEGSRTVNGLLEALPDLAGEQVALRWRSRLRVSRGRLHAGQGAGVEVHAAAYLRRRTLILDRALHSDPHELKRIVTHELFHFVWLRLGNPLRESWCALLKKQSVIGELGWSSAWRKELLLRIGYGRPGRRWREYACESFCDTAAWLFGDSNHHDEFTLDPAARAVRRGWFAAMIRHRKGCLRI